MNNYIFSFLMLIFLTPENKTELSILKKKYVHESFAGKSTIKFKKDKFIFHTRISRNPVGKNISKKNRLTGTYEIHSNNEQQWVILNFKNTNIDSLQIINSDTLKQFFNDDYTLFINK